MGQKITEAFSKIAAQAGGGPAGWATAITSLAIVAALLAAVGIAAGASISGGSSEGQKEKDKEEKSKGLDRAQEALDKVKEEPDGLDSNGHNFYEINKLHKKDLTPFTIEGLELLGYKIED